MLGIYLRRRKVIMQEARDLGIPVTLIARLAGYNRTYLYSHLEGNSQGLAEDPDLENEMI